MTAKVASDRGPAETALMQREQRERWIAWTTTLVGCLYCAWMGFHLWRSTGTFGAMLVGLGADVPTVTRILVDYRTWIYPVCSGTVVVILVAKELIVKDKRVSTMLTFLVTIAAQFLAHWMTTVYYLPLFDLIKKLS